ncbi:MAG: hypothetical protein IJC10_00210 [Clostridia bacterium]|nr:hypothetical protein [Clostridia bacterium]
MENNIQLAEKFLPVIDDIYKKQSVTQVLDNDTQVNFVGANKVQVLKTSTTGLGDYSRTDGYPKGEVTATWETMTLSVERGKELSIDRMDNEETLGMAFGAVTGSFMREWVVPEIDAYRFSKYASTDGISKASATLTADNILAAIDEAKKQMDADEIPEEGRILFVNSDLQLLLNQSVSRSYGSDAAVNTIMGAYNGMKVVYVPASRFVTKLELADGTTGCGFARATDAENINFMLVYPGSVLQVQKFAMPKIFTPDENQDKDMWKFQFRLYHDCFVYDNKVKGIYLNTAE